MDICDIFKRLYPLLFRYANRMMADFDEAEDVAQEAFLRLADRGCGGLEGEALRRWLFVVVRNLCLDRLRKASRHREVSAENYTEPESREERVDAKLCRGERGVEVRAAVMRLSPLMREVVVLREYEDMSYREIAQLTDSSLSAVKVRLARAREALRKDLSGMWEERKL